MARSKARYVDGFVLPVPKKKIAAYCRMAQKAGRIWREHGALEFRECRGEDLGVRMGVAFPKVVRARAGETVFFSWIAFRSRAHRDRVNAAVMKDERLSEMMEGQPMPFDVKRMAYGGFSILVDE